MTAPHFLRRVAVFIYCLTVAFALAETLPLPKNLIGLESQDGIQLLERSATRTAYKPLSESFETQKDPAYCGVATLVMILNALSIPVPSTQKAENPSPFTQENILNNLTEEILPQAVLIQEGMTLDQFGQLLSTFGVNNVVYHSDQTSVDDFRVKATKYLGANHRFVVVNYLRSVIGQEGGGHISPLGAYDVESDRFLVLDVSRYKYPPVWVKTTELFSAMDTVDKGNEERRRGFVLIGLGL
jgi:hypothetical protein